ncbi:MAG: alanine racemase [Elusimicrobia bacterium]|nr:alanine racemase [Elusimicrobiota bacterium]
MARDSRLHLKWIEIDLSAIRSNLRWTLSSLRRGVRLVAVVKADAYGHGLAVCRELAKAGAPSFGVLTVAEASSLRRAGMRVPIQLLAPLLPGNAGEAVSLSVTPTIDHIDQARALNASAPARGVGVHLDIDFGLGRWGVSPKSVFDFARRLSRLKRLRLEGLSTHIDYVPGKNSVEAEEKLRSFHSIAQRLKQENPALVCHAANSSVLMDFPQWQMDQVRVGNLLYGINKASAKSASLRNPWRFLARIIAVQEFARGRSIGYASEYVAPRKMRVATVAVGYADGLTMEPAERLISFGRGFQYWGMIGDKKAPFIGGCGIAHILLDVTNVPQARAGTVVALPIRRTAASSHLPRLYV